MNKHRQYLFIEGNDEETKWGLLPREIGGSSSSNIVKLSHSDLILNGCSGSKFRESVVFVNGHGSQCDIEPIRGRALLRLTQAIQSSFPSKAYYFHFGNCSLMNSQCQKISTLFEKFPTIRAVSGFATNVDANDALHLESRLLKLVRFTPNLDFQNLIALKESIRRDMPQHIRVLGFRFLIKFRT